jgi:hypothetical protein
MTTTPRMPRRQRSGLSRENFDYRGQGADTNLGQNVTPEGELLVWKVTEFQETIDPGAGCLRIREVRVAQFLFAGATVQRPDRCPGLRHRGARPPHCPAPSSLTICPRRSRSLDQNQQPAPRKKPATRRHHDCEGIYSGWAGIVLPACLCALVGRRSQRR